MPETSGPFLNQNIGVIADYPDYPTDREVREKLRRISTSTVERLPVKHRKKLKSGEPAG